LSSSPTGEVYLAQHAELPRRDALEILSPAMTADLGFRERFSRQTAALATLRHPHLAELYAGGESDGKFWVATEYAGGASAAQLVHDRFPAGMPAGEALAIVTAIAEALDYLHQRGLLHHNITPAGILVTEAQAGEHRILLADYG